MLTQRRWRAVLDMAAELAEIDDGVSFLRIATAGMQAALEVDVTAYCTWHPQRREAGRVVLAPELAKVPVDGVDVWNRHHREDIWLSHATTSGDRRAVRLTDLASTTALSRSPTYQACYRPSGFRYMAHLPLSMEPATSAAVGIGRLGRDIDDDDLLLLEMLRRPLAGTRLRLLRGGEDPERASVPDVTDRAGNTWVIRGRQSGAGGPTPVTPERLTGRQSQVLALVADGLTNDQIGRRLGISPRTVKKHLEGIFGRLHVTSRAAAAAYWAAGQSGTVPEGCMFPA